MKWLIRVVAVLAVAIAIFLIAAVINAVNSAGGAKPGVAVLYVVIAIALTAGAVLMWRRTSRPGAASAPPAGPQ